MRTLTVFTVLCCLLAAKPALGADRVVVVPLEARNGSNQSGTATLRAVGEKTVVTLKISGGGAESQPSHFHQGTCDKYAPRPLFPLKSLVNGESVTTLDVTIDALTSGNLIINVHKSAADIATQVSCGVAKVS